MEKLKTGLLWEPSDEAVSDYLRGVRAIGDSRGLIAQGLMRSSTLHIFVAFTRR